MDKESLSHHGVIGMKWGQHRARKSTNSVSLNRKITKLSDENIRLKKKKIKLQKSNLKSLKKQSKYYKKVYNTGSEISMKKLGKAIDKTAKVNKKMYKVDSKIRNHNTLINAMRKRIKEIKKEQVNAGKKFVQNEIKRRTSKK